MNKDRGVASWCLLREVEGFPPEFVKFKTYGDVHVFEALKTFEWLLDGRLPGKGFAVKDQ